MISRTIRASSCFIRPTMPRVVFSLSFTDGNVWLTQRQLSDLYQVSVKTVNEHLVNIYDDSELSPEATIRKFRIVRSEGNRQVSRLVDHFRLEAMLSVGYRVRSQRGVQFRRWATSRNRIREIPHSPFIIRGKLRT